MSKKYFDSQGAKSERIAKALAARKNSSASETHTYLAGRDRYTFGSLDLSGYLTSEEAESTYVSQDELESTVAEMVQDAINEDMIPAIDEAVDEKVSEVIDGLSYDDSVEDLSFVTSVSEADGVISVTKGTLTSSDGTIGIEQVDGGIDITVVKSSEDVYEEISDIEEAIDGLAEGKQDKLTAGYGIEISDDNVISSTIDTTVFIFVTELPDVGEENKIYCVPAEGSTEEDNVFDEFYWNDGAWEKMGSFFPKVDLSDYATIEYVDKADAEINASIDAVKDDVEGIEDRLDADEAAIEGINGSIGTINDSIDAINEAIDEVKESVEAVSESVSGLEEKHDSDVGTLNDLIKDLTAQESSDFTSLSDAVEGLQDTVEYLDEAKQDKLTAGYGIAINKINDEVTIECTIDTTLFIIATTLPAVGEENKFYLVPTSTEKYNVYTEYIWNANEWEKIGEYQPDVDLSDYLTKDEASSTYATIADLDSLSGAVSENEKDIDTLAEGLDEVRKDVDAISGSAITGIEASGDAVLSLTANVDGNKAVITGSVDAYSKDEVKALLDAIEGAESGDFSTILDYLNQIKAEVDRKQYILTAGEHIEINDNVISANLDGYSTKEEVDEVKDSLEARMDEISSEVDGSVMESIEELQKDVDALGESKQDKLTAGVGIAIDNNVVSCTIDTTLYKVVPSLDSVTDPDANVIYLVRKQDDSTLHATDIYQEYLWVDNYWELIGELEPSIDLDDYYTKEEIDEKLENVKDIDLSNYYTKTETDDKLESKQDALTAGDGISIDGNVVSAAIESIPIEEIDALF